MEETENKPIENEYLDESGHFKVGNPGGGRKPETEEVKLIRKARKEIIEDYKQALAEALPLIQPILIAKALEGDVSSIKEIHDRTMDKAKQPTDITSGGEKITITFDNHFNAPSTTPKTERDNTESSEI